MTVDRQLFVFKCNSTSHYHCEQKYKVPRFVKKYKVATRDRNNYIVSFILQTSKFEMTITIHPRQKATIDYMHVASSSVRMQISRRVTYLIAICSGILYITHLNIFNMFLPIRQRMFELCGSFSRVS
jgi:hypothetical protein